MDVVLLGTGAFAREAYDWVTQSGRRVVGFYSPAEDKTTLRGLPVFRRPQDIPAGAGWIVGMGNPVLLRRALTEVEPRVPAAPAVVHPTVVLGSNVRIGAGSIVCPGSVLTCDIDVGRGVLINLACTVGHDTRIGDLVVLSPNVSLSGLTTVGAGATVGTGATTIPGVTIAPSSIIGAGASLVRSAEEGVHVGMPARLVRPLRPDERA